MAAYQNFKTLRVDLRPNGVMFVTMTSDDPNETQVMTLLVFQELDNLTRKVETDDGVRVLVVRSSNPSFWICHFSVDALLDTKVDTPAKRFSKVAGIPLLCDRVRTMGKPTIAEVVGRTGGGGTEFASAFDMRFGVMGTTIVSNAEVGLGLLAGAGGTVRWPWLTGRGRALEVLMGAVELDASTAERWGWLNRAFATPQLCSHYVEWLADRMASLPAEALRLTKASVDNSLAKPHQRTEALKDEAFFFNQLMRTPEAQDLMRRFMERGGQTFAVESKPDALLASKL